MALARSGALVGQELIAARRSAEPSASDRLGRISRPVGLWSGITLAVLSVLGLYEVAERLGFRGALWPPSGWTLLLAAGAVALVSLVALQQRADSNRHRTAEALQASETRFRRIAETITEVFWMADVNIQTMLYVSPSYERIWGRSCESLYASPRSFIDAIHPDDKPRVLGDQGLKREGKPFEMEYRIIRPDGEIRWIWDRGFPVKDEGSDSEYYVGAAQDITERRLAQEATREAEERMRFALEAAQVGVWEANLRTGETHWSSICESIHGLGAGEFRRTFDAFLGRIHEEDREDVRREISRSMEERSDADFEYRVLMPDGTVRWIRTHGRFVYDGQGAAARGAGIVRDVTERRSLEEQLRQAQKMEAIGRLAGGIAHDFNNMLTAILGNAELFLTLLPPDAADRTFLDEIMRAAQRAATLTHQLLAFSRKQLLSLRVLRVGGVVEGVSPMLQRLIGDSIDLQIAVTDRGYIKADAAQLEQVILNLAVNARDAMGSGGQLTIRTADVTLGEGETRHLPLLTPGPYVMLAVNDTGHGMDAATLKRLFEPFFTTKPVGEGTGLGLAMVYGIVKQSGGHIAVDSEVGLGTTFRVYLPRTEAPGAATTASATATPPAQRGSETVLLVEDEDVVRGFVKNVLTRQGYVVHAVDHPRAALELASAHEGPIQIILADLALPVMSGQVMSGLLKERHPEAKVLFMSGYSEEALGGPVSNSDMAFLQKPFTADVLIRKVRGILDAPPHTPAL